MPQSLSKILLHVVFSTKNRNAWVDHRLQPRLHAYVAGACRVVGSEAYRVGGMDDHIHIACSLPRTLTVGKLLEQIKKSSSSWMKKQGNRFQSFSWQAGYGAFSLGQSQLPVLINYIENQHEHHKSRTFKEEFLDFLKLYGVDYNEKYLWD